MRTKGSKNKKPRKQADNNSAERMRELAEARRLPEKSATIRVLKSARDALVASVPKKDRTVFASTAIMTALEQ